MNKSQRRNNLNKNITTDDSELLFDSEFLSKIERLAISSKITMVDGASGNRKSKSKGSSVEFSDYREYTIGDDFRRIDWHAYGRFEKLFIKLFMEEREAPVHIFLDTSRSMDFGIPNKSFTSRRLAAALGYLFLSNYDSVSLICVNKKVDRMKLSMRGKNNFAALLNFLEQVEYSGETDLFTSIKQAEIQGNRGISVVISDLFSYGTDKSDLKQEVNKERKVFSVKTYSNTENSATQKKYQNSTDAYIDEIIKFLQYKKQDVYICHILSPQETEPAVNENYRLLDSETGEYLDVTATRDLLKVYKEALNGFLARIENTCVKRGMKYMLINTSTPVDVVIKKILST